MNTRFEAVFEVKLGDPTPACCVLFQEWCNRWNCRVLAASTSSNRAAFAMPYQTFKRIFGRTPTKGPVSVPLKLSKVCLEMKVTGINILELRMNAT